MASLSDKSDLSDSSDDSRCRKMDPVVISAHFLICPAWNPEALIA